MAYFRRGIPALSGRHTILLLGVGYVTLSVLIALIQVGGQLPVDIVVVVSLLTFGSGFVLCYGGYRLLQTDIHSTFYGRNAGWCFGGFGVMGGILTLTVLVSGVVDIVHNVLILTALGSVAGFGMGLYDAQARTRAHEAEQRSRDLARQNDRLERFAEMLAHELRNPLTIAKGDHCMEKPRNEDAAAEVALAHDRIEVMISVLLVAVRVSKVSIDDEPVVVAELATSVWDGLAVQT